MEAGDEDAVGGGSVHGVAGGEKEVPVYPIRRSYSS
jgi:hypothetical protein